MEKDIKAIIVMLATQAMINLGKIQDPLSGDYKNDPAGAAAFMQLLEVLSRKTQGNLTAEEEKFLFDIRDNLTRLYKKEISAFPDSKEKTKQPGPAVSKSRRGEPVPPHIGSNENPG